MEGGWEGREVKLPVHNNRASLSSCPHLLGSYVVAQRVVCSSDQRRVAIKSRPELEEVLWGCGQKGGVWYSLGEVLTQS